MAGRHRRSEWNSQSDYLWRALSSRVYTATPCEEIRKSVAFCSSHVQQLVIQLRKERHMSQTDKVPVNVDISQVLNAVVDLSKDVSEVKTTLVNMDRRMDRMEDRMDSMYHWIIGVLVTVLLGEPGVLILLKLFHVI